MHRIHRRSFVAVAASAALVSSLALLPSAGTAAEVEHHAAGHVYVLNNNLSGQNSITVFARAHDGTLSPAGSTPIGGLGSVAAFADGTQGSLISTSNGKRLFAVDAGSDQISVVDVDDGELESAGVFPSGGVGPVSLTFDDDLLYVLNAANANPSAAANVAGFRVDRRGNLTSIPGATRPLSSAHPNPAEVLLDPQHRFLLVTEKATNMIDIYHVAHDGSLSAPTSVPSVGNTPFGMAFSHDGSRPELVVADAGIPPAFIGAATAYRLVNG